MIQSSLFHREFLVSVLFFGVVVSVTYAKEISCTISDSSYGYDETVRTCWTTQLLIDEPNVTISTKDDTVERIYFYDSMLTYFLPIKVSESLPNLIVFDAGQCSIKTITKENFAGLVKLKVLYMRDNYIEKIFSDTFEDLISLERINLSGNRIRYMNPETFQNLNNLQRVELEMNDCISEDFRGRNQVAMLIEQLKDDCQFDETEIEVNKCENQSPNTESSNQFSCNSKSEDRFDERWPRTCAVEVKSYPIGWTLSENCDETIKKLTFYKNGKEEVHLPENVVKNFPRLEHFTAHSCSIKKVTKSNFEGLEDLRIVELQYNLIEEIDGDTFEGLKSLKSVDLNSNNIKIIHGNPFHGLKRLRTVNLLSNICINIDFDRPTRMSKLQKTLAKNCGSDEQENSEDSEETPKFVESDKSLSKRLPCTKISDSDFGHDEVVKTCWAEHFVIDDMTVGMEKNDSVERLYMYNSIVVSFLPVKLKKSYPNLLVIDAGKCSIKEISRENFFGLDKLKAIYLKENQIEKISGDTFRDLKALEKIDLKKNKLKWINGVVFDGLSQLKIVELKSNICIDENFEGSTELENLQSDVTEKCGFDEPEQEKSFQELDDFKEIEVQKVMAGAEKKSKSDDKKADDNDEFKSVEERRILAGAVVKGQEKNEKGNGIKLIASFLVVLCSFLLIVF